jgi:hypothetical protein
MTTFKAFLRMRFAKPLTTSSAMAAVGTTTLTTLARVWLRELFEATVNLTNISSICSRRLGFTEKEKEKEKMKRLRHRMRTLPRLPKSFSYHPILFERCFSFLPLVVFSLEFGQNDTLDFFCFFLMIPRRCFFVNIRYRKFYQMARPHQKGFE